MPEAAESPLVVAILFALRCLVPLLLMLGVSYLLKRLGLIAEPPQAPPEKTMATMTATGITSREEA